MSKNIGDFDLSAVIYGKFATFRPSTGAAYTLGGTPALSVYKDNSTTQSTTGVTLTADFDSVTGLNHFAIDTSADGTFYSSGSFFDIVITTGTVDSVSVVGAVVGSFTLRKTSALKPTTAGRTLVVDASGLADANTVKIGPTGSGTAQTARDVGASVLLSTGTGTGQLDFTSGVVKANLAQILGTALTETAGQIAAGFKKVFDVASPVFTAASVNQTGDSYARLGAPAGASHAADVAAVKAVLPAALVSGRIDASVGAYQTGLTPLQPATAGRTLVVDAAGLADANVVKLGPTGSGTAQTARDIGASVLVGDKTGFSLSAAGVQAIWDALTSALTTVGSIGKLLVDNVNASISAIKTQTDKFVFTVANQVDANVLDWKSATAPAMTGDAFARLGAPAGASVSADIAAAKADTAAIKLKTDNLPSDPADQSQVEAAILALLTTQLTESYAADGTAPTLAQSLFMIQQMLGEFSISGTTLTLKKLNGSTTAATFTLDSATSPTSITRAS